MEGGTLSAKIQTSKDSDEMVGQFANPGSGIKMDNAFAEFGGNAIEQNIELLCGDALHVVPGAAILCVAVRAQPSTERDLVAALIQKSRIAAAMALLPPTRTFLSV